MLPAAYLGEDRIVLGLLTGKGSRAGPQGDPRGGGGLVQLSIGKVNFTDEQLMDNFRAALGAILKAKPSGGRAATSKASR